MATIELEGKAYPCEENETVLDCLTRHGVQVPSSCRAGVCQSCMMRAEQGEIPKAAQVGLKPTRVTQGYFLACSCKPQDDLRIRFPDAEGLRMGARVVGKELLSHDIVAVRLVPDKPMDYRAGQFIRLFRDGGLSRCYSLASVPVLDEWLELHVRHVPGGQVSGWVHGDLSPGDSVQIADSSGHCFYVPDQQDRAMLLVGTGSGLAPLYGIVRDALHQGHWGPVWLYHGSHGSKGLYRVDELHELERQFANFHYVPCVSHEKPSNGMRQGMVLDVVAGDHESLDGWQAFLCGHPDMVTLGKTQLFLSGVSLSEIYADPFVAS